MSVSSSKKLVRHRFDPRTIEACEEIIKKHLTGWVITPLGKMRRGLVRQSETEGILADIHALLGKSP